MKKKVSEWKYKDLNDYANQRACDGNWSIMLATTVISFIQEAHKHLFKEKYWQKNKHLVFNLEAFPNMEIDIDTGEIGGLTNG